MVILSASDLQEEENSRIIKGLRNITEQINLLSAQSFGHQTVSPTIETAISENAFIGYLEMDGQIVASGFGREDTHKPDSKFKTMYIHTFSTKEEYRGRGLCKQIVGEFIKKFGKTHILYLTVRTELSNVNESAIRCYEKIDFIMLPEVYRNHYDGKNSAMVRMPTHAKKASLRKKKKSKKNKKKSRRKRK